MGKDSLMGRIISEALEILNDEERKWILPLLLMMLAGAIIESLGVSTVIPLVSAMVGGHSIDSISGGALNRILVHLNSSVSLSALVIFLIFVFIIKNVFLLLETYAQHAFTAKIRKRVQNRLLHYYLSQPYGWFLDKNSGDILRTITVDSDYFISLLNHLLQFFTDLIMTAVMIILVFLIHPKITMLLAAVLLMEYFFVLKVIRPLLRKYGLEYRKALGRGNNQIIELLRGIKYVKVSGKEKWFEERYSREVSDLTEAKKMERSFQGASGRFIEAVTVTTILLYLLVFISSEKETAQLIPVMSAFVLASAKILPGISNITNSISYSGYYESSLNNVMKIDRALKQTEENKIQRIDYALTDCISLDNISFSYPERGEVVLDHVSMQIRKNHSVGIIGSSGSGKTTLVDILLGLLKTEEGEVCIDGEKADTQNDGWKRLFTYIPQQIFILSGTIKDNVVFGEKADAECEGKIWEALKTAQLEEFVQSLPEGLNTTVGEAGVNLSGGQIQRLGIARALYSDAPVLVFDEATSALDFETESALMSAIDHLHGNKTIIIITHRLSTIENCDEIYQVEGSKVALQQQRP